MAPIAILFGVFPWQFPGGQPSVLRYMDKSIEQQVQDLAEWTREEEASQRAGAVRRMPPAATQPVSTTTEL